MTTEDYPVQVLDKDNPKSMSYRWIKVVPPKDSNHPFSPNYVETEEDAEERAALVRQIENTLPTNTNLNVIYHEFETKTLKMLQQSAQHTDGLLNAVCWMNRAKREIGNQRLRELLTYCQPHNIGIGRTMMEHMLDMVRASHPRFAYGDLSELQGEDAEAVKTVLSFIVTLYRKTGSDWWDERSDAGWTDMHNHPDGVRDICPEPNEQLVELLLEHPHKLDLFVRYFVERNEYASNADLASLEEYIKTPSALIEGAL